MFDVTQTDNLQYQSHFVDTDYITWWDQKEKIVLLCEAHSIKETEQRLVGSESD